MKFTWRLYIKRANDNINSHGMWKSAADGQQALTLSLLPVSSYNCRLYL